MRSAIFSLVSGIVLTLLLRGPAPAPHAPTPPCACPAAALQKSALSTAAQVVEALRDTLAARPAGQDARAVVAATAVLGSDDTVWSILEITIRDGCPFADPPE